MRWHGRIYLISLIVFMYFPIIFLMIYSFNSANNMVEFKGFTLQHYVTLFTNAHLMSVILNTISVALLAAAVATVIGTLGAVGVYYLRKRKLKNTIIALNNVLMVSSDVVIGASFLIMFIALGQITSLGLGFTTVLISHIAFCIPIVFILVLPQLFEMNHNILHAARDLGATEGQVLSQVLLPQLMPAIVGGFFMALTYSLDDFTVSFFVTGNGFSVLSVEVYAMARKGISMEINAISTLVFLFIMMGIVFYYILKRLSKNARKRGLSS